MKTNAVTHAGHCFGTIAAHLVSAGPGLRGLFLVVLLGLTLPIGGWTQEFAYETTNGQITLTGYLGPGGAVTIPGTLNGLTVTSIKDYAFSDLANLVSVTIPDSVTSIGEGAFYGATNLTSVTIGGGVAHIGGYVFAECSSLITITVDSSNPSYSSVDGVLFDRSQATLIQYPAGRVGTTYTIPNTVTNIGDNAFYLCARLTDITIPTNTSGIGDYAFWFCTNLTSVTIPDGVASIGLYTFGGCSGLTHVLIAKSVTSIGPSAFGDCSSLRTIAVDALNPSYGSLDGVLFDKTQATLIQYPQARLGTAYTIPNSVTNIGPAAFQFCARLTGVVIPNSVTHMAESAFDQCTGLTSVVIPESVTSIDYGVFQACAGLTNVTIPNTVTDIGIYAFARCSSLATVTIPKSVRNIEAMAWSYCTSLTSVTVPNSVTNIGPGAFSGCDNLTSITVDALNAFYSSVDGLLFNGSQTTLVQFPGGKAGGVYTIPATVAHIGPHAFGGCAKLNSVTIPSGVVSLDWDAFFNCANLTNITLPDSLTSIGSGVFEFCSGLTSLIIPASVTNIDYAGYAQFDGCTNLTGVYFRGNAPSVDPSAFQSYGVSEVVYYLPGTRGWGPTFGSRPTAPWVLPYPLILHQTPGFGVQVNVFGFTISWATHTSVVVEACTNLANPVWSPVSTNALVRGSSYFTDPQWANSPARFYRLRSP